MGNLPLQVNGARLWQRLQDMAAHGATPAGGCNRQALTDEDLAGRALFTGWCEQAGCSISVDEVGNVFARRPGTDPGLPPVMAGSHLDTQPSGGRYDGVYGVLAGLEVIESLNDHKLSTRHPVEVVVWTNEEGCRFDAAMMGSAVWSGKMLLENAYALVDRSGVSVHDELLRTGQLGSAAASAYPVHAAFELHIEQGPVLEAGNLAIGVVTGVQHMSRHRVVVQGVEAHAGPTPMELRKDPMMALADCLPRLYAMARQYQPDSRITFGYISAEPGSSNTVPGSLEFTVDIRHPDKESYQCMLEQYRQIVETACAQYELPVELACFWEAPGVAFDERCIDAVQGAVTRLGYSHRRMVSGAGHDACNLSTVAPTSMIFIPCEGGLSHNEAEAITPQQCETGANVLLLAIMETAEVVA